MSARENFVAFAGAWVLLEGLSIINGYPCGDRRQSHHVVPHSWCEGASPIVANTPRENLYHCVGVRVIDERLQPRLFSSCYVERSGYSSRTQSFM